MPRTEEALQQIREGQREKILEAAKSVFSKKGSRATMADIAAEANISQGLAYRYFTSKEEIFNTLVKQSIRSAGNYDKMIRKLPGTPAERLETIITRLLELRRERPGYYQFLLQIISDGSMPSEISETMAKHAMTLQKEMLKLIVEGQRAGEIANDEPAQLLEAVMASIEGIWRRMSYSGPGKVQPNFPTARIILRMLKPDKRPIKR